MHLIWRYVLTLYRPFADAVKAGVGSVMCSYNQLNNSYACQNSYILNHVLKKELDFQGFGMFYFFVSLCAYDLILVNSDE